MNKKKKKSFFYHGHDLMQILKINQIVGFVVDYLHPVLLVYPDSKALIEWPLESLF